MRVLLVCMTCLAVALAAAACVGAPDPVSWRRVLQYVPVDRLSWAAIKALFQP
jgi:NhaP-type Na+/H+ or K+/H+ antiporter